MCLARARLGDHTGASHCHTGGVSRHIPAAALHAPSLLIINSEFLRNSSLPFLEFHLPHYLYTCVAAYVVVASSESSATSKFIYSSGNARIAIQA